MIAEFKTLSSAKVGGDLTVNKDINAHTNVIVDGELESKNVIVISSDEFEDRIDQRIYKGTLSKGDNIIQTFPIGTLINLSTVKFYITFYSSTKKTVCESLVMAMGNISNIDVYSLINSDKINPLMTGMSCSIQDGYLRIHATVSDECQCVLNGNATYIDDITGLIFGAETQPLQFSDESGTVILSLE